jgi:AraC family transcriptional regulator of adaptative response/methylated-DNA-[protein]-cysteine methyltransferase
MLKELMTTTIDPASAWQAVLARDSSRDGAFVYAVTTTGVFCRPGCPSRRPRRENVRIFAAPSEAEAAGFRECRRCRPKSVPAVERLVAEVKRQLEADNDATPTLQELATSLDLSPGYLQRRFKQATGVSPRGYAAGLRAQSLRSRLKTGDDVTTATYAAGFGSISSVYEQAPGMLGMTPGSYRRGGEGMSIEFTTTPSFLGRVLLAATSRGVCFIAIGDDDAELRAALGREYPRAQLQQAPERLREHVAGLRAYIEGGLRQASLPLDLRGSSFQLLVWQALQAVPAGETRTYQQIAAAIGRPSGARAVAQACATNPLPLLVPCHRVVRSDGASGGYRWGESRKRRLLDLEQQSDTAVNGDR